jgi:hypothetical protein
MELDITDFFNKAIPMDYSASQAEIGRNAGADTWRAACDDSDEYPLLDSDEKRSEFRQFVRGTGGWEDSEIAQWSDKELNALCIQFVSADVRESDMTPESDADDWQRYYNNGAISGTLTLAENGRVYYLMDV